MSIECGECERDLRSGHDSSCSRYPLNAMSPTQRKVLNLVSNSLNGNRQIAGYGAAPLISAANALMRKGWLNSFRTGSFFITNQGKALLARKWRPELD